MRAKPVSPERQLELIMECRQSGMSDCQWCLEHDIKPSTFYNWVSKQRALACADIPAPAARNNDVSKQQEVVRISMQQMPPQLSKTGDNNGQISEQISVPLPVMEVALNGAVVRITNDVSPMLLSQTLSILGGMSC